LQREVITQEISKNMEETLNKAMIADTFVCNSVVLAKYIAAYANANGFVINMTKLQKLLYITYGLYLAVKGKRLTNEHPQAWPYGPVFPTTRNRLLKVNLEDIKDEHDETITDEIKSCVKLVFKTYGIYNGSYLSQWSHQFGSPWDQTVRTDGFTWGDRIPDEYIQEYFQNLIIGRNEDK